MLKIKELQNVREAFMTIMDVGGEKLSYMAEKNLRYVDKAIKDTEKKAVELRPKEDNEKIKDFFKEQEDTMKAHAKIENDKPVKTENGQYAIDPTKVKDMEKAMEELKKKHPEAVKEIEDYNIKYNELLDDEIEIDFYYAGR